MKRFLSFLLIISLVFLFAIGCKKNNNEPSKEESKPAETQEKTNEPTVPVVGEFEVSFVTNCSTEAEKQKVKRATEISLPTLEKEGYTFKGFYLDSEFKTKFSQSTYELKSNITLYALFEINSYLVNFKVDDNVISGQIVEYGKSAEKPADPKKEGFTFKGWDQDFSNVKSDLTINALFEAQKFTVTFKNGDTVIETQEVEYGKAATAPADPTKDGYTFTGWDKDLTSIKSDLVVNAKFKAQTFDVKFKLTDDSDYYFDIQEVEYGKSAETPTDPERVGFVFKGWDQDFSNITSDLIVTALWDVKKVTVKYIVDGLIYAEVEVEYGKAPTAPADPTKDGYTFKGWDKEITEATYDCNVEAIFEALSFSIKYYYNTQELNFAPASYKTGDEIALPTNEVEGYIFAGWYLSSDFTSASIDKIDKTTSGNLTLYALNVKVDIGSFPTTWTFSGFNGTNTAAKGIDAVSDLPEQYERDFYTYLVNNKHLDDSRLNSAMKVTSWAEFSRVNPNHNGDPQRVWNDTSTNYVGGADGYSALFLFDKLELNDDKTLKDIHGGFLGTEPYKTKYWNLTYSLVQMVQYKYNTVDFTEASAINNGYFAFVIDGYFYGTQGVSDKTFKALREVVPSTTTYYKVEVENNVYVAKAYTREYKNTTDLSNLNKALAIPLCDGKAFVGWYLDSELTKPVTSNPPTQNCTLYPKFE